MRVGYVGTKIAWTAQGLNFSMRKHKSPERQIPGLHGPPLDPIREFLSRNGAKGGRAGTGAAKRRPTEHYRQASLKRWKAAKSAESGFGLAINSVKINVDKRLGFCKVTP